MGNYFCRFHWLPQMKKSKGGLVKNFLLPRHIAASATAKLFFLDIVPNGQERPLFSSGGCPKCDRDARNVFSLRRCLSLPSMHGPK